MGKDGQQKQMVRPELSYKVSCSLALKKKQKQKNEPANQNSTVSGKLCHIAHGHLTSLFHLGSPLRSLLGALIM